MHPRDKITIETEDALQELASDLEQIAEEIRRRGLRDRFVGDVAGAVPRLRELASAADRLVGCSPPPSFPASLAALEDDMLKALQSIDEGRGESLEQVFSDLRKRTSARLQSLLSGPTH